MRIGIRQYSAADIPSMIRIWNEIVEEGNAFPQEDCLTAETRMAIQELRGPLEECMTDDGCKRKFDIDQYIQRIDAL